MGRGRAKAKQRKVARELKYFTPDSDLSALERELRAAGNQREQSSSSDDFEDDDEIEYEDRWAVDDEDEVDDPQGRR